MGEGQLLLKLQETDLELVRHRSELNALPEIKSLAQKRKSLATAKDELLRVTGRRKDLETYLSELDEEERLCLEDIEHAQEHAASAMDYSEVQDIEYELSQLAKELDKIAFERKDYQSQLEAISEREAKGSSFIAKLEKAILTAAQAARDHASGIQEDIERCTRTREKILSGLPADVQKRYEVASKRYNGLAVERLQGSIPSICRMTLTESSLNDLKRAGALTECPYCHRILIVEED